MAFSRSRKALMLALTWPIYSSAPLASPDRADRFTPDDDDDTYACLRVGMIRMTIMMMMIVVVVMMIMITIMTMRMVKMMLLLLMMMTAVVLTDERVHGGLPDGLCGLAVRQTRLGRRHQP
jgi:hypothetical protein